MLDPRIYRMALLPVVLAVIVLAFSLSDQQGPMGTNLAPDAYNGQNAYTAMHRFASQYPNRRPGSIGDDALASAVAAQLRANHFHVSTDVFKGKTADGTRTLENVVAVRAGLSSGSIVVVAHRDSLRSPSTADLSGTAVLVELARVLSGQSLQHTVVLASTTGSAGAVGAARLAHTLPRPVDAVIALGDLAGTAVHGPIVVPWGTGQRVAPPTLRKTLAAALGAQAGLPAGRTGLGGQLAHLALPMSASEQAPFGDAGEPAVRLSLSGERPPAPNEPTSLNQITALGRTVVQSITALDAGQSVPAPSAYLEFSGKSIPAWAIRLLVLTLIIPVLVTTVDGLARARRRGHSLFRWCVWVLGAALPFALVVAVIVIARMTGLIVAPASPLGADAVTLHAGQIAALAGMALLVVAGLIWIRRFVIWLLGPGPRELSAGSHGPGAASAVMLVLCLAALAIWVANPFAALLLVPALHLWLWIVVPDVRLPAPVTIVLLLAGMAAPALVVAAYATTLALGPLEVAWSWVLLLAGGGVGVVTALLWCLVFGCTFSVIVIALHAARERRPEDVPVTVRGPVTYAGPGSLGGTESALRR